MNRYSDYQIRSIAERRCEEIIKCIEIIRDGKMETGFHDEDVRVMEYYLRELVERDDYIYKNVISPDADFTIDEVDAILFTMCSFFRDKYGLNFTYQQLLKNSHFEEDWDKEDFGAMPRKLIENGWEDDNSADKLMHKFSKHTNLIPTYARMEKLSNIINETIADDIWSKAAYDVDAMLGK